MPCHPWVSELIILFLFTDFEKFDGGGGGDGTGCIQKCKFYEHVTVKYSPCWFSQSIVEKDTSRECKNQKINLKIDRLFPRIKTIFSWPNSEPVCEKIYDSDIEQELENFLLTFLAE